MSTLADENPKRAATLTQPVRCWQARRQISAYLDEDRAPATQAVVESHLAVCPTRPPLYASLVGVRTQLSELRDPDSVVPGEIAARVADRMSKVRSRSRR